MAAPSSLRPLRLVLPIAGVVAILAAGMLQADRTDAATATVTSGVKKPRPVKRSVQGARNASKVSVKRVKRTAKRPVKAKPPIKRAAVQPRPKVEAPAVPNDPLWSQSWSLAKTNAAAAWKLTAGGPETVIAVLDTGVDLSHPDLQGSFVQGYDFVNRDDDPTDDHGHGTMVAGVVAARANNGLGGIGACSRCSLMPIKVIGADGSGTAAGIAEGIVWAVDHGASVINMSFVMSGPDQGVANALEHARSKGVLVVAAAGNAGSSELTFPAGQPGVVGVAATDAADARYDWSSYGSWVTLAAPGCSQSTAAGGGYGEFCGTSSATAFVSGVAGLARSYAPDRPAVEIVETLASSAARVGDFVTSGRVDADALLNSLLRPQAAIVPGGTAPPPAAGAASPSSSAWSE